MEIKQDINFLDKPLWFLSTNDFGKEGFVWTDIDGYKYRAGYKLPDKIDMLFLFYMLLKSQKLGYKQKMIFSRYEIIKECNVSMDNRSYERLKDSLERWINVTINFEGTFYDGKEYISIGFHVIDSYEIRKEDGKLEVHFNPKWLLKVKESKFCKYVNFEQYKALKRPISRRLFEILCKSFKGREHWEIDLVKLGEKLSFSKRKVYSNGEEKEVMYHSDVLAKLKPAISEINKLAENENVFRSFEFAPTDIFEIDYELKKDNKIIVFKKRKPDWMLKKAGSDEKEEIEADLESLFKISKSNSKGAKLAIKEAFKENGFEYVKWNILYSNRKATKNYSAFLKKSLKENWGAEDQEAEAKKEEIEKTQQNEKRKKKQEIEKAHQKSDELKKAYEALEHKEIARLEPLAIERCVKLGMPRDFIPKITLMEKIVEIHQENRP